jgi:uncharacterized membrane protein YeaQ/YmgE (transglycosylase-associated protein family)
MESNFLVTNLLYGGIFGMIGQSLRLIVGLKKSYSEAALVGHSFSQTFDWGQLVSGLIIGFVSGVIASFIVIDETNQGSFNKQMLMGFVAAGYSGADFIEGFVRKALPSNADGTQIRNVDHSNLIESDENPAVG